MKLFFIITGILCIVYCLSILLFTGYGSLFFLMWGILGSILLIWVRLATKYSCICRMAEKNNRYIDLLWNSAVCMRRRNDCERFL